MTPPSEFETKPIGAYQKAIAVQEKYEEALLNRANVEGVGVGLRMRAGELTDEVVLVVMVTRKVPRAQLAPDDFVPSEIEGVPVDIQEIGHVRAG
ncbi:MAG: hypothetical protein KAI06_04800 [Anaerolineales bacterium]|nr:hypothetical protein [Anaerolineales bacterium]